ncbi:MAG: MrpF/PhaF family protein [Burkholderiales bacterium]|nr:MrpF/PhaF family protein [Burkholderiales bacterium]
MTTFLLAAAAFVLLLTAVGLKPLLRARGAADRIMAVQLLGSGGIGALLLFAEGTERYTAIDVSLTLALLAAFVSVALAKSARRLDAPAPATDSADRQ